MDDKTAIEDAVQAGRMLSIFEHVKQNNVGYLLGMLLCYQMGILDKVITHGQGICA